MSFTIAIAGKGGTGKTTLASLLVREIKQAKQGGILAIDADPNSNLGEFLGVKVKQSIGSLVDDIAASPEIIPQGMSKDRFIDYKINEIIEESEGFDLLTMGRPEGPGCYCYVNNVLRNVMLRLSKGYDYIVIDNEAGLEHLSRRTSRRADCLLIVSDPSEAGLRAAKRINELSSELKFEIAKKFLLINRAEADFKLKNFDGFDGVSYLGEIPFDGQISQKSRLSSSLIGLSGSAVSMKKLKEIIKRLWE